MAQNIITEERVIAEVKKAVAETMGSDASSIGVDSSLIREVGVESLDLLDINYRLEQTFGIRMARHFILEHIEDKFGEGTAIDENGQLTEKAIRFLKARYGDEFHGVRENMDADDVPSLIAVRTMAGGVMEILNTLSETCPKCGKAAWKTEDGLKIACGSCGDPGTYINGDDLTSKWLDRIQAEQAIC